MYPVTHLVTWVGGGLHGGTLSVPINVHDTSRSCSMDGAAGSYVV